ncbi:MAG TPA: O-antigen ligase family protein [Candidatus Sulfotelmatobacter sp.]|jgi:putative inorganic carbon (HCO3(-)) transporter|nr:O-antigen ligase family protein [Candidatus Sulfotelmatobacter sp.]
MKLITYCNKVIEYSFYSLFFLVPLAFSGDTSELFELNKMWLTFGITVIISATWVTKMVLQKNISIQKTPIDIFILLFLTSQIISSIFSFDQYISLWGYYSRFNGGLFSTICYIILYYAFVTNLTVKHVFKTLLVSLFSGLAVALWGFPSHFGADPTCLVFRGNLDTSCWTDAFKPTIRAFSTLGQPAWLAAYMAFLIPVSVAYALKNKAKMNTAIAFLSLAVFLYLLLVFSDTRAGFIGFWIANIIFWAALFFKKIYSRQYFLRVFFLVNFLFVLCSFIFGSPLGTLNKYTLPYIITATTSTPAASTKQSSPPAQAGGSSLDDNITDSGTIRLLVWQGALRAWENNPLFGTGVETFAFAYYKYKLPAHNLISEWDYLYNKAHNEYLNYLATTGFIGLGTYLSFIGIFFFVTSKQLIKQRGIYKPAALKVQSGNASEKNNTIVIVTFGLLAGYVSMLITNFFGFSVVIINLYIFLVPAFVFMLLELLDENRHFIFPRDAFQDIKDNNVTPYQWTAITIFILIAGWMLLGLIWYRQADIAYALGNNLDKVGQYQQAYPQLVQAVQMIPNEPVYKDELSINLAALSAGLYAQKDSIQATQLAQNAIALSDDVVNNHPNNVIYWKDRVRLFYTLSATDTKNGAMYLGQAIKAINAAKILAPTDAKIAYNQGVLYGQAGDFSQAIQMLTNTIRLKKDYLDAYVALGLFYHEIAVDKNSKVINQDMQQKAIDTYSYILKNLTPNNNAVKKSLQDWRTSQ